MAKAGRKNACSACMKAKRACDKKDPSCGRCAERQIKCQYSKNSLHIRNRHARLAPRSEQRIVAKAVSVDGTPSQPARVPPNGELVLLARGQTTVSCLDPERQPNNDLMSPTIANENNSMKLDQRFSTDIVSVSGGNFNPFWFLTGDLWRTEHNFAPVGIMPFSFYKDFTKGILGWLRDWVNDGCNPFIHSQLYRSGLPSCLQDAFATLTAYLAKNQRTEDMILQILDDRATGLVQQSVLLAGIEAIDLTGHLARTQSLLIYSILRLYDGCPRQRARAELLLPTLTQWYNEMLAAAAAEIPLFSHLLTSQAPRADGELDAVAWRTWILSESIRRTWLLASTSVVVYELITNSCVTCAGSLPFTVRRGLWEAKSASMWMREINKKDPLVSSLLTPLELTKIVPPAEVDPFMHLILTVMMNRDQVDHWNAAYDEK